MDISERQRHNLRAFMTKHRLITNKWAKEAKVAEGTIRAFLSGKSGSLTSVVIEKLAKVVNVHPAELLFDSKQKLYDDKILDRDLMQRSMNKVNEIIAESKLQLEPEIITKIYLAWYDLKILSIEQEEKQDASKQRFATIVKMIR